jgi:gas vesicle protein
MRRDDHSGKIMMMLVGSFVGAAVALLLAPQTGERTRKELVRAGKKAGNRAQKFVSRIAKDLDRTIGDIIEFSESGMEKGKELTGKTREEILDVLDAGKVFIEEERAKLEKIFK